MSLLLRKQVVLPLLVLALVAGSAVAASGAERLRPVTQLSVVDSQGRVIRAIDHAPIVVFTVGDVPIAFVVTRERLLGAGHTNEAHLMFESADCSGQPFVEFEDATTPEDFYPHMPLNNGRIYKFIGGAHRPLAVLSYIPDQGSCQQGTPGQFGSPVELLVDVGAEFRPPYRLRYGRD
jgi:hypothetical protein